MLHSEGDSLHKQDVGGGEQDNQVRFRLSSYCSGDSPYWWM